MQKSKRPAFIVSIVLLLIVVLSVIILATIALRTPDGYKINLEVWGPIDDSDAFGGINREYTEVNPFVGKIQYKKMLVDEYKRDVLDALAAGNGPDIFLIHNTWIPEFQDKIVAVPDLLITEDGVRRDFVDVVASDVIKNGEIYGVPLSVDSLALYYNKDILNFEGIANPPKTWAEFLSLTQRLTVLDKSGAVIQSGAALGTARNINRSTDILNALFLQSGTNLEYTTREAKGTVSNIKLGVPAQSALNFYTQFSDINSPVYTWNLQEDYSIDAFQEGNAVMMLNYSWHYDTIKRKNNRLNFAVAPLPQFEGKNPANYANYWVFVVAKNKNTDDIQGDVPNSDTAQKIRIFESWEYLRYLTMYRGGPYTLTNLLTQTQKDFSFPLDPAKTYTEITKTPSARRDLVEEQKTDPILGPFATGNLIAKSWIQGDPASIETLMAEIIDSVHLGKMSEAEAIRLLEERIRTLLRR